MATRLLCWVTLCLLGVEPTDAGVTQTPRHKVTKKGQELTVGCEPVPGHDDLFWYRQTSVQGLELIIYFRSQSPVGVPMERFSAQMPNESFSALKIQSTEPGDSAVYLCASSIATALQSHPLPVQKPARFPFLPQPQLS